MQVILLLPLFAFILGALHFWHDYSLFPHHTGVYNSFFANTVLDSHRFWLRHTFQFLYNMIVLGYAKLQFFGGWPIFLPLTYPFTQFAVSSSISDTPYYRLCAFLNTIFPSNVLQCRISHCLLPLVFPNFFCFSNHDILKAKQTKKTKQKRPKTPSFIKNIDFFGCGIKSIAFPVEFMSHPQINDSTTKQNCPL